MKNSAEDLRETMRAKTNEELYLILRVHSKDYTPEAIKAASEEFSHRQLDEPTMNWIMAAANKALGRTDVKHGQPDQKPESNAEYTTTSFGLGWFILLCILGYATYGGYEWLDGGGWIPHDHDTPVWIQGDWLVGEYRDCGMRTTTPFVGIVLSQEARAELPRLFCGKNWAAEGVAEFETAMPDPDAAVNAILGKGDWGALDSYFHVLPVHYNGRIDRPDSVFISWRCQRNTASLTCWALN